MAMLQRRMASSVYAVRRSLERMKERREAILADPEAYRRKRIEGRIPDDFDELPEEEQLQLLDRLIQGGFGGSAMKLVVRALSACTKRQAKAPAPRPDSRTTTGEPLPWQ